MKNNTMAPKAQSLWDLLGLQSLTIHLFVRQGVACDDASGPVRLSVVALECVTCAACLKAVHP